MDEDGYLRHDTEQNSTHIPCSAHVPFNWEQDGVLEAPKSGSKDRKEAIKAPAELAPKGQEEELEAKTLFAHMDSDGSGQLSTAELEKGLTQLGFSMSEVTEIMDRADLNRDNQVVCV